MLHVTHQPPAFAAEGVGLLVHRRGVRGGQLQVHFATQPQLVGEDAFALGGKVMVMMVVMVMVMMVVMVVVVVIVVVVLIMGIVIVIVCVCARACVCVCR